VPRPVRIVLVVLLIAIVVVVLFTVVFPRVEQIFEQDPTVSGLPAALLGAVTATA
jgi:type II secretory pathway component PulF